MINSITNSSTRLIALAVGAALVASVAFGSFAAPARAALTESQIQSILSLLSSFGADQATINNVNASLRGQATPGTGTGTGTGTGGACPALSRSLQQGASGADVKELQVFLNANAATQVSSSGAGSPGSETTFFGPATDAAVKKFQTLNNVSSIGIVGPQTRAAIAAVCGTSGGGTTPTPTGPGLTVTAGAQPANALAPQGAARVPFTTFTVTNNSGSVATVNGITVERVGLGVDGNLSGVVLIDAVNNIQLGTAKTLNSNHQATVGDSFTINPGETKTLTVAGNISSVSNVSGQIVSLQVVAIAATVPVVGTLPIMGASHTINTTLSLGSVSTTSSSFDPGSDTNKNIGDTAVRFSGIRFTAGSAEDLKLYSIRWRQVGTASAVDISNVMTYVNGTAYAATVDTTGRYYTTTFPGGITILKGNSVDVYAQGDLTGSNSANRSVAMDIDKVTDVYFVGQTYGYGVAPSGTYTPWFDGYTVTINPGTVTLIGKANEVASQNIAPGVANQPLGGFATNFAGESVAVSGMTVTFSTSTAATGLLTSVTVVDENGAVVAGPVDTTWSSGTMTATFTDSVTFTTGRHVYTIKGKLPSTASNNASIYATTVPSNWSSPVGETSGNSITISTGTFDMNTMTVKAGALSVTAGSQPASQSIVAGAQGFTFATIQLDASASGEDVRLSSAPVYFLDTTGSLDGYLTGCQLFDGSTALNTGSRVENTITTATNHTFSFDNSLTVTKGTVKNLDLKCNVASNAAGAGKFGINSGTYSVTGVTSGSTITATVAGGVYSGTMTVGSGSFAVSVDSSSPSYTTVAAGSTGVTGTVIKFRATNEAVSLTKVGLSLENSDGSAAYNDVVQANIYDGATLVGTAYFTGNNETATSTLNSALTLPKDTDKLLTVKVNLAGIGTSESGSAGKLIKIDPLNAEGNGLSSGGTLRVGSTGASAGFRAFKSYPTVALDTLASTGANGNTALMRFKVTANSAGPVGLSQLEFTLSTSSASVTATNLYVYTDSSYSSPISGQGSSGLIGSGDVEVGSSPYTVVHAPTTNPIAIPAGSTYYFELRGTVTPGASATNWSVNTTLKGDSAYPTNLTSGYYVATSTAVTGVGAGNFVWTGNSTTTSAFIDVDWTNGYGVPGLPSNGLTQSRSN